MKGRDGPLPVWSNRRRKVAIASFCYWPALTHGVYHVSVARCCFDTWPKSQLLLFRQQLATSATTGGRAVVSMALTITSVGTDQR